MNMLFVNHLNISLLCSVSMFYAYQVKEWVSRPLLSPWPAPLTQGLQHWGTEVLRLMQEHSTSGIQWLTTYISFNLAESFTGDLVESLVLNSHLPSIIITVGNDDMIFHCWINLSSQTFNPPLQSNIIMTHINLIMIVADLWQKTKISFFDSYSPLKKWN